MVGKIIINSYSLYQKDGAIQLSRADELSKLIVNTSLKSRKFLSLKRKKD